MCNIRIVTSESIGDCKDGDQVQITTALSAISVKKTKSAGKMAIARIEAASGFVEAIIFPDVYREAQDLLKEDVAVTIQGILDDPRPEYTLKIKVTRILL